MSLSVRPYLGAVIPVAMVVVPAMLASSSSAGLAQVQVQPEPIVAPVPAPTAPEAPAATAAILIPDEAPAPVREASAPEARHVECVAKIIMHEARHEPRAGRVAVAQVVRARIRDGRFARDACGVARQRGQFFNVDAFQPSRAHPDWADAVAIADETLRGGNQDVVPGALFFHAAHVPMRGRTRVGRVGGHVFYR